MASNRKLASRCRLRHAHPAAATQPIVAMGWRATGRSLEAMTGNIPGAITGDPKVPARASCTHGLRRSMSRQPAANGPPGGSPGRPTVRQESTGTVGSMDELRVLVGVDSSAESLAALDWALRLASAMGGRVVVVHAVGLLEAGGYRPGPDAGAIVAEVRQRLGKGSDVLVDVINEDGAAADVIGRVATRENADLIVVGSRGLGEAPRVLGSASEGVLAHAHVPVLVVPGS